MTPDFIIVAGLFAGGVLFLLALFAFTLLRLVRQLRFLQQRQAAEVELIVKSIQMLEQQQQIQSQRQQSLLANQQKLQLDLEQQRKRSAPDEKQGAAEPLPPRTVH